MEPDGKYCPSKVLLPYLFYQSNKKYKQRHAINYLITIHIKLLQNKYNLQKDKEFKYNNVCFTLQPFTFKFLAVFDIYCNIWSTLP